MTICGTLCIYLRIFLIKFTQCSHKNRNFFLTTAINTKKKLHFPPQDDVFPFKIFLYGFMYFYVCVYASQFKQVVGISKKFA